MKLDIGFPAHFVARPKKARFLRDIVATQRLVVDVPEVGRSETEIAYESRLAFKSSASGPPSARTYRMLVHSGKLYRRIATPSKIEETTRRAFAESWHASRNSITSISLASVADGPGNPASNTLQNQIAWRLQTDEKGRDRKPNTWPPTQERSGFFAARTEILNSKLVHDFLHELSGIDVGSVERSRGDALLEADRLLLIDGELWIESAPPAFRVDYDYSTKRFMMDIAIAPREITTDPLTAFFPLHAEDEATSYLHKYSSSSTYEDATVSTYTVGFETDGSDLLRFDHDGLWIRNVVHNVLASNERYIRSADPEFVKTFLTDGMAREQEDAFGKAIEADFLRGELHDLSGHAENAFHLWKKCRRPSYDFHIHAGRKAIGDLMMARSLEILENRPISIPTFRPASPKP